MDISSWRFILWDRSDGPRPFPGSSGALGMVGHDHHAFSSAIWPKASLSAPSRLSDLEVGACIYNVVFQSCGIKQAFDIYRVQ